MPRKFLGQRVEIGVDFVRPSSLTLTADDLQHIPPNGFETDEAKTYGLGSRISRKFGGTIRLKKRLESVPELFLHDFKKKPSKKRSKRSSTLRRIEPPKVVLPTVEEVEPKPLLTDDEIDQLFVSNRIVMPVMVKPPSGAFTAHDNGSMSSNEMLYNEIISAYGPTSPARRPQLLNHEIDRVLEHISHKNMSKKSLPALSPTIYNPEIPRPITPELRPPSPAMSEKISSPEYTGISSSDRWSSGDEFSDLGSALASNGNEHDEEDYVTARNSLRDPNSTLITRANTKTKHSIQPVKVKKVELIPCIFTPDDEEEQRSTDDSDTSELSPMQLLQMKIDSIDIASCSSSIYSDN